MAKLKRIFPAPYSELDLKANPLKLHLQNSEFSKNIGASTNVRDEKVEIKDGKTGQIFGVRTMAGKSTSMMQTFEAEEGLVAKDIETALPDEEVAVIKSNVRKGAKDITQNWKNALELIQKAYQVAGAPRPNPEEKIAWSQYEELIQYSVQQLAKYRGLDGQWRTTQLGLKPM